MIERYNPHLIQKRILPLHDRQQGLISLEEDVISQARNIWGGNPKWSNPFRTQYQAAPEIIGEYGIDVARIAEITNSNRPPDEALLESSHRWLSRIYARTLPAKKPAKQKWNPDQWLIAALAARDHLLTRGKMYVALSVIKKAWKLSPIEHEAGINEKTMAFVLLSPFAPCLAQTLLTRTDGTFPATNLEELCESFYPRQAVKVGFYGGGWNWEVVDSHAFKKDPMGSLMEFQWIAKVVKGREWSVRKDNEGWLICLNLPNGK